MARINYNVEGNYSQDLFNISAATRLFTIVPGIPLPKINQTNDTNGKAFLFYAQHFTKALYVAAMVDGFVGTVSSHNKKLLVKDLKDPEKNIAAADLKK